MLRQRSMLIKTKNPSCFRAEPNQNGDKLSEGEEVLDPLITLSGPLSRKNRPINLEFGAGQNSG
jgi:hypothetical protein